jgi:hypothetical protein
MAELSRNEIFGQKISGNAKIQKMSGIWICPDLGELCELKKSGILDQLLTSSEAISGKT